jgi:hypothetical protein
MDGRSLFRSRRQRLVLQLTPLLDLLLIVFFVQQIHTRLMARDLLAKEAAHSAELEEAAAVETAGLRAELEASRASTERLRRAVLLADIADIWELSLAADGKLGLVVKGAPLLAGFEPGSAEELAQRVLSLAAAPGFERPKSRILILYSYGDAPRGDRRMAEKAGGILTARLPGLWPGTVQADFIDLGWTGTPP